MTRDKRISNLTRDLIEAQRVQMRAILPHEISACDRRIRNITDLLNEAKSKAPDAIFEYDEWHDPYR